MSVSIMLAQIFGLYLLIISAAMLINKKHYQKILPKVLEDEGVILFAGVFTLILGIILITIHNIWAWDWRVIITLLAWLTFISGIFRVFFPQYLHKWKRTIKNNYFYYASFVVWILLGLYLVCKGFCGA